MTQMFFETCCYAEFVARAREQGIVVPILPGLKPLVRYDQVKVLSERFGCMIPDELRAEVEKYKADKNAVRQVGIEWCVKQCRELVAAGAPGIHLYAARKAPIGEVVKRIV